MGEYQNFLVKADTERLLEVLQNIIENAIKYGSGKKIGISISKEEDCVLITVENTGEVLPAEELPHLFDSFYRGSNAGSQEGSGLGLYICRKLMHKMNGDVFPETGRKSFFGNCGSGYGKLVNEKGRKKM